MSQKKKLKSIRSSFLSRGLSLAKVGLQAGAQAASFAITEVFTEEKLKALRKKAYTVSQIKNLAEELGKLKGSVMKVGQMLSIYGEHFLPPEANQILKKLQRESPPLEWKEIRKQLLKELGKEKLAQLDIEEESTAAASLGQVHRAKIITTGQIIALKVQYPGVGKAIKGDIQTLRSLLNVFEILPNLPDTDQLFEEIQDMLIQELNYEQEKEMLKKFRKLLKDDTRYIIPEPIDAFSTKRILAMNFEDGLNVDSEEILSVPQKDRNYIAQAVLDLFFRELYEFQAAQTDPHFGNYRIRLHTNAPPKILLYDYGAVRKFPAAFLAEHKNMLRGILNKDRKFFEKSSIALKVLDPSDPQELKDIFHKLCVLILEPFLEDKEYQWSKANDLPKRVSAISLEMIRGFSLRSPPREVLFLDRKMIGMFTFVSVLEAKFNAREVLLRHFEKPLKG